MIIIAGKNNIAVSALEILCDLVDKNDLAFIPNQTDMGVDSWQRSLIKRAKELNIAQTNTQSIKREDIVVSLEFDKIIKTADYPYTKMYNIHFSKLPAYKGMYTSVFPIMYGEKESGVTLHEIDPGIDTGNIISNVVFNIDSNDRAYDLYRKYIKNSINLFKNNIQSLISENIVSYPQDSVGSSYFSKQSLDFNDIQIDFKKTAWQIKNFIYSLSFRPYQLVHFNKKKIASVDILDSKSKKKYGTILRYDDDSVDIATIDYDIRFYFDSIDITLGKFSDCSTADIDKIIKHICGINDRDINGISPIIKVAKSGNINTVDYLLSLGADINDVDYYGKSVLMHAVDFCLKHKEKDFFQYLVSLGANVQLRDFNNKSIYDYLSDKDKCFLGL